MKLPMIPDDVCDQIYMAVSQFGCARWKAVLKYAQLVVKYDSNLLEDRRDKETLGKLAEKAAQNLLVYAKAKGLKKTDFGKEKIIIANKNVKPSFADLNAFEAYVEVVKDAVEGSSTRCEFCQAGKAARPLHYAFLVSSGKEVVNYNVIIYGLDGMARVDFYNKTNKQYKNKNSITLLVITDAYMPEDFNELRVLGKSRIAFITEANPRKKTYECSLSPIMEEMI